MWTRSEASWRTWAAADDEDTAAAEAAPRLVETVAVPQLTG